VQPARTLSLLAVLAGFALQACGEEPGPLEGDCAGRLQWQTGSWDGLGLPVREPDVARVLGRGALLGCGDEVAERGDIVAIAGVPPGVAVALRPDDPESGWSLWGRPGFIVESERHPAHDLVFRDPEGPHVEAGYRCGEPVRLRARAVTTPRYGWIPLKLHGVRPADRRALRALGRRIVQFGPRTRIEGALRHGIPYVRAEDDLEVVLKHCEGLEQEEPGPFRTGEQLVVDELLLRR
jgi:hypothetical protein